MDTNISNLNERLCWIDGLKGISAIIVVLSHTYILLHGIESWQFYYNSYLPFVRNLINGNFAVWIFVMLSSFLVLHGIQCNTDNVLEQYKKVAIGRYFRIFVPVSLVIILMFVLNKLDMFYSEEYGIKKNNEWLIGQYVDGHSILKSMIMAPMGRCGPVLNVGWMLGFVFIGTYLTIVIDLIIRERRTITKVFFLVLFVVMSMWSDYHYVSVILAIILWNLKGFITNKKVCILLFVALFVFSEFYKHTELWNIIRAFALVAIVYFSQSAQRFLGGRVFRWLGHLSMNIYLLQLMVMYLFTCRLADMLDTTIFGYRLLLYFSTLAITILFAWLWKHNIDPVIAKIQNNIIGWLK